MTTEYDVGFGKPPKHSQFRKGQSGNPKGRPQGARNLKTELEEEFSERIPVKEDGKSKKVPKQRAMIKALMARAVTGDVRAATLLFTMWLKVMPVGADMPTEDELTPTDRKILEEFRMEVLSAAKTKGKPNAK